MPQVTLCMASEASLEKLEEVVRTVRFMMPRSELHFYVEGDGRTVRFLCNSADSLTLSSTVLMLKHMLAPHGRVR